MNQKQLISLILVLAVLGIAGGILLKKRSATWDGGGAGAGEKVLPKLPVGEELALVRIEQGSNALTLAKKEGVWTVQQRGDYPADYAKLSRAVLKLRDLKAGQVEPIGDAQRARLELVANATNDSSATRIEFRDAQDTLLSALLLGKEQMRKGTEPSPYGGEPSEMPVGRWLLNPDSPDKAILVSETLSEFAPSPSDWLNKDFFKVEKVKSIAVNHREPTNSFKIERESDTAEWKLAAPKEGEELDSSKTSGFNYALSSPSFQDVLLTPETGWGMDAPTEVTMETFEGFTYTLRVGAKQDDAYALTLTVTGDYPRERKAEEGEEEGIKATRDKEFTDTLKKLDDKLAKEKALAQWTYKVSSWTLDSVLKKRSELLKEKPAEAAEGETSGAKPEGEEPPPLPDFGVPKME
jgi:hypothetical protein